MKNRRTVVVAFLLIAVMLLGVGYAALTDVLEVTGTIKADPSNSQNEFENDIYFESADIITPPASGNAEIHLSADKDTASFEVIGLTTKDHYVVFKLVIKNDYELPALITPRVETGKVTNDAADGHKPVFEVSWSWDSTVSQNGPVEIDAKTGDVAGTKELWVTVKLVQIPTEPHEASYTLTFDVTDNSDH